MVAESVLSNMASDIVKHQLTRFENLGFIGDSLKSLGLIDYNFRDNLTRAIQDALKIYFEKYRDYDLAGVRGFLTSPETADQISNYLVHNKPLETADATLQRVKDHFPVSANTLKEKGLDAGSILPNFLGCLQDPLSTHLSPSEILIISMIRQQNEVLAQQAELQQETLDNTRAILDQNVEMRKWIAQVLAREAESAPTTTPQIFLSYARADDEPFVKKLYESLVEDGFSIWWDRVDMPSRGLDFTDEIKLAIKSCDRLLLVFGPAAKDSAYVRMEWEHALKHCKVVNPVLRLGEYEDIPEKIPAVDSRDFRDDENYEKELAHLIRQLKQDPPPITRVVGVEPVPSYFVPRDDDFNTLRENIIHGDTALTAVQGMGGIGKTGLATVLSNDCETQRHFHDGIYWVQLDEQTSDTTTVQAELIKDITGAEQPEAIPDAKTGKKRLTEILREKQALIVLDNVWKEQHAQDFQVNARDTRLLITTRKRSIATEIGANPQTLDKISLEQGLQIIANRTNQAYDPLDPYRQDKADLVQEVGFNTLAVNVVALQLNNRPKDYAKTLVQRLRDQKEKPTDLDTSITKEIWAAFEVSYNDLPDDRLDLQRAFRLTGLLLGGVSFNRQDAQVLFAYANEHDTDDALHLLVQHGLLELDPEHGTYSQHDLLRVYAKYLFEEAEDLTLAEQSLRWYNLGQSVSNRDSLVNPLQYFNQSLATSQELGDIRGVSVTQNAIANLYVQLGRIDDALSLFNQSLATKQELGDIRGVSVTQHEIANLYVQLGRIDDALSLFNQSLATTQELGDIRGVAVTQHAIANLYVQLGRIDDALSLFNQSLATTQELGDIRGVSVTQHEIAKLYVQLGRIDDALSLFNQSLATKQELGDIRGVAVTQHAIANLYVQLGRIDDALSLFNQSLATFQELGDIRGVSVTQHEIANLYVQLGRIDDALSLFNQSLATTQELGDMREVAVTQHAIANLYVQLGRIDDALSLFNQSLATFQELGDIRGVSVTQHEIANLYVQLGRIDDALSLFNQSLATKQELGDIRGVSVTQNAIANLYVQLGRIDDALSLFNQSLATKQELGDMREVAVTQHEIAKLYVQLGRIDDALSLFNQSLATKQELGDIRGVSVTQHEIANLYVKLGRIDDALSLFNQSLATKQELGDMREVAVTQHAIANLYVQLGRIDDALSLFNQSLATKQELGDMREVAVTQHAIANLYVQLGRIDDALSLFNQSLATKQELGDIRGVSVTQVTIGQVLVMQGDCVQGLARIREGLQSAQSMQGEDVIVGQIKEILEQAEKHCTDN